MISFILSARLLYHKWDVENGFAYVIKFFSLISEGLGGVGSKNNLFFRRQAFLLLVASNLSIQVSVCSCTISQWHQHPFVPQCVLMDAKETDWKENIFLTEKFLSNQFLNQLDKCYKGMMQRFGRFFRKTNF